MAIDLAAAGFAILATACFVPGYFWVLDHLDVRSSHRWVALLVDTGMHVGFLFALVLFLDGGGEPMVDRAAERLWRQLPASSQATLEGWFGPQDFTRRPD